MQDSCVTMLKNNSIWDSYGDRIFNQSVIIELRLEGGPIYHKRNVEF